MGTYQKGSFCGGSNIYLNLLTYVGKIVIPRILQSYVLHWYHMYLLHPEMEGTEAMIFRRFYFPGIRNAVWKEVMNFDTFQRKKRSNKKIW